MSIRYRPIEPEDVPICAAIISRHPVLGPRYREEIRHLVPVWLNLLHSDAVVGTVFEEVQGTTRIVLGAGMDVFVTNDFIAELKTFPHFWIGPEIVARIHQGKSPVLSDKQMREANTVGGLNAAVWHTGVLPENLSRPEVGNTIMGAFVELHRGFLLKELVFQVEAVAHVEAASYIGAFFWNTRDGSYEPFDGPAARRGLLQDRHVLGLTRDLASHWNGSWGASSFLYYAPRFGFSRSEQRLLFCGLAGVTDEEIAGRLGISLVAVRKRWRTIYERVETISTGVVPNPILESEESGERGKTKKQVVLAYVREHPEELRPVSRKLLRASQIRSGKIREQALGAQG